MWGAVRTRRRLGGEARQGRDEGADSRTGRMGVEEGFGSGGE